MRMAELTAASIPYSVSGAKPVAELGKEAPDIEIQDSQKENSQIRGQQITETQTALDQPEKRSEYTDISQLPLTFRKEEPFAYIGGDSSLSRLDMEKAVSDMKKDKIFEQYQYFVGRKPDLEYDDDIDGTFFRKE